MNVSYLAASTNQHIQPFMQLAETLGAMAAQLGASHVHTYVHTYIYIRIATIDTLISMNTLIACMYACM